MLSCELECFLHFSILLVIVEILGSQYRYLLKLVMFFCRYFINLVFIDVFPRLFCRSYYFSLPFPLFHWNVWDLVDRCVNFLVFALRFHCIVEVVICCNFKYFFLLLVLVISYFSAIISFLPISVFCVLLYLFLCAIAECTRLLL